jgi:hypothetical protein
MRRPLTIRAPKLMLPMMILAAALAPSTAFAQDPPPAPAAAQPPAAPKLAFTTDAGLLLVQIKGDQTAVFEDLVARLKAGAAKAEDATVKQQSANLKVYKTAEGAAGGNALYVILIDPVAKDAEYELFALLQKVMTQDELRAPETRDFFTKAVAAFAAGLNKLSLTPVGK